MYVSSVAILRFFQSDEKQIDIKKKSKLLITYNVTLFALASLLIPSIYGKEYFSLEIVSFVAILVFFSSMNELLVQDFYKKGNLRSEIVIKILMILGLCLLFVMHQQSFFRVTASVIMYFFIIIEIVRTLVLMSYGKKNAREFLSN